MSQTIDFTKSDNVITAVAVGEKNFTVSEYASKFKYEYDTLGNVIIIIETNPGEKTWVICPITSVSFDSVFATNFSNIESSLQDLIYGTTSTLPYKIYTAILAQESTNEPSATVLGTITFPSNIQYEYLDSGSYKISLVEGSFNNAKTIVFITKPPAGNVYAAVQLGYIILTSRDNAGALADGMLFNTPIEIREYP